MNADLKELYALHHGRRAECGDAASPFSDLDPMGDYEAVLHQFREAGKQSTRILVHDVDIQARGTVNVSEPVMTSWARDQLNIIMRG